MKFGVFGNGYVKPRLVMPPRITNNFLKKVRDRYLIQNLSL